MPILSCGGDKQSFTVVLAVKANGEKLPPKAIFKGVRQLRIQVPRGMQVSVQSQEGLDGGRRFVLFPLSFGVYNSGHDNFLGRFVAKFAIFRGSEVWNLFDCF